MNIVKRFIPSIKFLERNSVAILLPLSNVTYFCPLNTTELKPYSPYVKKTEPPLAQSSKGASHTLSHTTLPPPFPQTSQEGTPTQPFSIWLLPVESPQVGFLISTRKISYSLIELQLLHCTQACDYNFHTLAVLLPHPTLTATSIRRTFRARSNI